jgi:hypothetical protein
MLQTEARTRQCREVSAGEVTMSRGCHRADFEINGGEVLIASNAASPSNISAVNIEVCHWHNCGACEGNFIDMHSCIDVSMLLFG